MRPASSPTKGFTLLELTITLALFAGMMTLLLGGFFQFQRGKEKLSHHQGLTQRLRLAEHLLAQDLQSALFAKSFARVATAAEPERPSGIWAENHSLGTREEDKLHLHTARRSRFYRGEERAFGPGLHEVSWFVTEEAGVRHLVRREEYSLDPDITRGPRSQGHSILRGIASFDLKFYEAGGKEPLEEWQSKAEHPLPQAVKVTMQLQDGEQTLETSFTLNLRPKMGPVTWGGR